MFATASTSTTEPFDAVSHRGPPANRPDPDLGAVSHRGLPAHGPDPGAESHRDLREYRADLPTSELLDEIGALRRHRLVIERLTCRYLADLGERIAACPGSPECGGYADVFEVAKKLLGLDTRATRERVRVGRALRGLPRIEQALEGGAMSFARVREITRVACVENEPTSSGVERIRIPVSSAHDAGGPSSCSEERVDERRDGGTFRQDDQEPEHQQGDGHRQEPVPLPLRQEPEKITEDGDLGHGLIVPFGGASVEVAARLTPGDGSEARMLGRLR
jgi:hypothetical protein